MTLYHCLCDPHGDNARCDRPCAKPAHVVAAEIAAMIAELREQRLQREAKEPTDVR
jgi:hypothetical protein